MSSLTTPLAELIGGRTAKPFEKAFDIRTVGDLLRHYPRRMAERGELTDLASLRIDDDVTVLAEVLTSGIKGYDKGLRVEVVVSDGRGRLNLVFFGKRSTWRLRELHPGVRGLFSGRVGMFGKTRQLAHPDYLLLHGDGLDEHEADDFAGALIPVYAASKDLRTWTISNTVHIVLGMLDPLPDPVPVEMRARRGLLTFDTAIRTIHRPANRDEWYAARRRLKWDEALGVQLALAQRRAKALIIRR